MMDTVGGIPVECLTSPELSRIWSGWSSMKDREVIREAAAKGTHIDLAYKFLSHRRNWTIDKAQNFFDSEVEVWINELLEKRQVHRASHILQNMKKNSLDYIRQICLNTTNPNIRDYLAIHMINNSGFTDDEKQAWDIINCLNSYKEKNNNSLEILKKYNVNINASIQEILNLPHNIKDALITELYFHIYEVCLSTKLKPEIVWDYLLLNNEFDLLTSWIDIQFNSEKSIIIEEKNNLDIFEKFNITDSMIERIELSGVMTPVKEYLFNYLAQHGIFIRKERADMKLILSRLFKSSIIPSEFYKILSKPHCNLNRTDFFRQIHSIIYYQEKENCSEELYEKDTNLLNLLYDTSKNFNVETEKIFNLAVSETIHRISDDVEVYLNANPLITFYLIMSKYKISKNIMVQKEDENNLPKHFEFKEFIYNDKNEIMSDVNVKQEFIKTLFTNLPYLKDAVNGECEKNDISIYQLIQGFENFNANEFFKWRSSHKGLPHFRCENLIKQYGYQEKLTYKYYLKELRPSTAAYVLRKEQKTLSCSKRKSQVAFDAHILGLKHINNPEMIITCITFLEFVGIDSNYLRFHVTAANYVENNLNISINDLLESVTYHRSNNNNNNNKDLAIIMNYLERSFENECYHKEVAINNVMEFTLLLKSWDFLVKFSRLHNSSLPSWFIKYLARQDQWFEFVVVSDTFGYPLEQVLDNVMEFKNPNIREHLLIALSNSRVLSEVYAGNDLKNRKSLDLKPLNSSSTHANKESGTFNMTDSSSNLHYFPLNHNDSIYSNNLWVTILKCHKSLDPPRASLKAAREYKSPILAIVAACYEPSATTIYFYSWIVISIDDQQLTEDYADCLEDQIWTARKVSELFRRAIALGYVDTISRGFQIFMPENCLCSLFNFLVQYSKYCDIKKCTHYLKRFLNSCSTLKRNKMIDWNDLAYIFLNNEYWIAIVAIECILTALGNFLKSIELQTKLLAILVENNFNAQLHFEGLNFKMLWEIITSLSSTNIKIDFTAIKLSESSSTLTEEILKCIEKLIDADNFNTALEISQIANLSCSKIILDQYRREFNKNKLIKNVENSFDVQFLEKCARDIKKYNVSFQDSAEFFVEHAKMLDSHKERYEILRLAHETLKPISTDQQTLDTVEMAMWKSCILAGPDSIEIQAERRPFNKLKTELLSGLSNLQVNCVLSDKNKEKAVELLINRFIDVEDLETALRISAIFNYKHHDLKIIMLCLSLAEGEITPDEVNIGYKVCSSEFDDPQPARFITKNQRSIQRRHSGYFGNLSSPAKSTADTSSTSNSMEIDESNADCIMLLTKLIKINLKHQSNVGDKILLLYKLSNVLKKSYNSLLVIKDPIELLTDLTEVNHETNFNLMMDVITVYRLNDTEVSKFFAGKIISHIIKHVDDYLDNSVHIWGNPFAVNLLLIRDLCNDSSLIGWELMNSVNTRLGHSRGSKRDFEALKIVCELLIQAHYFFTAECDMEGIACVLRKCRNLANVLQNLKFWSLLVQLVTGVGRFTEMNYIFKILKENDQFEFLLRQRNVNRSGLRVALLEFWKKSYSDDQEMFKLITEHFQLFTENAIRWENEAKTVVRELIKETRKERIKLMNSLQVTIKFTRNSKTDEKLRAAMRYFTHAAEHYFKDEKLNMANRCTHQAHLIALQLSLLNSVSQNQEVGCLLNLSDDEVDKTMYQPLALSQMIILVEAYNHNVDWPNVIYHHVVRNGELRFLKDFLDYRRLTPGIVQDCVYKYRMEKNISKQMALSMQSLITELSDVECKYVLASQLGFKNIVEAMLADVTISAYLKDTVWKQGYNPQEFIGENFRR